MAALTHKSVITIGLAEIQVGVAAPNGTMPKELAKIGKVYRDTCKIAQDTADVTEHFEEGYAAPVYRKKTRKIPKLTFSICDADVQTLVDYIGGENVGGEGDLAIWGYNGNELVTDRAIKVKTEQGLDFEIPNADIEATLNGDMSAKGIFMVDFTVTPKSVSAGKAIRGVPKTATVTDPKV